LASRLSFFLWSTVPDDELINVAASGQLHEPAMFERQVRRMLVDPKSKALVDNFAAQWLFLRNLQSFIPDSDEFPNWDDNLRQAAAFPAGRSAAAQGNRRRRQAAVIAGADGTAPRIAGVRDLPSRHGSARLLAGKLRRDRPLARA